MAVRAGISSADFWRSTGFLVTEAFLSAANEQQKAMSTVAYRTALFTRMKHNLLPKNETELLKKPAPKKKTQSLKDQLAMARFMTQVMGSEAKH